MAFMPTDFFSMSLSWMLLLWWRVGGLIGEWAEVWIAQLRVLTGEVWASMEVVVDCRAFSCSFAPF